VVLVKTPYQGILCPVCWTPPKKERVDKRTTADLMLSSPTIIARDPVNDSIYRILVGERW